MTPLSSRARNMVVAIAALVMVATLLRLIIVSSENPSPLNLFATEVAFFLLAGTLAFKQIASERGPSVATTKTISKANILVLKITFVVSLTVAVLSLRYSLYVPTPVYYLGVAGATSIEGLEILCTSDLRGRKPALLLGQITLIGAVVQLAFPWLNPHAVYSDTAFHWYDIGLIVQTGRISSALGYYTFFPSFHILNLALVEIAGIQLTTFTMANHALMILAVPSIYLLAREIVSPRKALAAALLTIPSVFFFLPVQVLPSLVGATLMILALWALLEHRKTKALSWWVVFWILALFVFFSHPVNALVLGVILVAFWINVGGQPGLTARPRRFAAPTWTYVVIYIAYLVMMAVNALTIFLESLVNSGPQINLARVATGPFPQDFVEQSLLSTLGFSVLFFPTTIALLYWIFHGTENQRFMAVVIGALTFVAGGVVVSGQGSYGLQAARLLIYIDVFMAIPACFGMSVVLRRLRTDRRAAVVVIASLLMLSVLAGTSYLTGSGNRLLSSSIPVQTSYVTDSILASRHFLLQIPNGTPLALDPTLTDYMAPFGARVGYPITSYPIPHSPMVVFSSGLGNGSVALAVSQLYQALSGYEKTDTRPFESLYEVRGYDDGGVIVFLPGGN